jgi:hypothetical protein
MMKPDGVIALPELLRDAANELARASSAPILSCYDTTDGLAAYLNAAAERLGAKDERDLPELLAIFAPTCDWDDSGGSVEMGNKVFAALCRYRSAS